MIFKPKLTVTRFAQLSPGDLFIYNEGAGGCAAIKTAHPQDRDQPMAFSLGPTFSDKSNEPKIIGDPGGAVVSFGNDYVIRLPISPLEWGPSDKAPGDTYMVTNGDNVFFRFLSGRSEIFIDIAAGKICDGIPNGILASTKFWEIGREDGEAFQMIVKGTQ